MSSQTTLDGEGRSTIVGIFSNALSIADGLAPLLADPEIDGRTAGGYGIQAGESLRKLKEALELVPDIPGIPDDVQNALLKLARIVRGTHRNCVTYPDVAYYLARSEMRNIARAGWQALVWSKPENDAVLSWAADPEAETTAKTDSHKTNGQVPTENPQTTPTSKAEAKVLWLSRAMLMVQEHPDWSDAAIARAVGKSPSTLSRDPTYQQAASLARGHSTGIRPGHITVDAETGLHDVESPVMGMTSQDHFSDRGQPILGSKYFREYCSGCLEPMKVTPDRVGKNPICEHCGR